jgi:hypothetical protein
VNSQVSSGGVWSDVVSFEVVGTSFAGFLSLPGGGFGYTLVVKPASNMPWDGDEYVLIGGEEPFYGDQNLDSIAIAIPDVPVASQTLEVGDQGPGDVIQTRSFLVTSRFTQNTDPLTSPDITAGPFPMEFYISLYDGSPDHFYTLAPGADMGVRVSMEFQTNADLDVTWTDQSFSFNVGNFDGAGTSPWYQSLRNVDGDGAERSHLAAVVQQVGCWGRDAQDDGVGAHRDRGARPDHGRAEPLLRAHAYR